MALPETAARPAPPRSQADRLVDELLPESVPWERLVRRYPIPSLLVAAAAGYFLGRSHGRAIATALTVAAARQVQDSVERLAGGGFGGD
jgi:hypothetical protein